MIKPPLYVIPILHPAYIMRDGWGKDPAQVAYLETFRTLLDRDLDFPDVTLAPPKTNLDPSLASLLTFESRLGPSPLIACDIECAGDVLVCVGLCNIATEETVVVSLRDKAGILAEPSATLEPKLIWLYDFLANPDYGLIFHNGQAFDVPYLERQGFVIGNYAADTMLMQYYAYPEMPKGLGFCGTLYCNIPNWKHLVAEGDEAEGKA